MPPDPDLLYQAGLVSYQKGEFAGAEALFHQAAMLGHPKAPVALQKLQAEISLQQYKPIPYFQTSQTQKPQDRITYLAKAITKRH